MTHEHPEPQLRGERLRDALGPIAAGLLIDGVDFATFGPLGLVAGPLLGGVVGFWAASVYGFSGRGRWGLAAAVAAYCAIPSTEMLPLATVASVLSRLAPLRSG